MERNGVAEVDILTEQLYSGRDPLLRQQAQASLEVLTKEDTDSSLQYAILQQSNSQYTLLFMAQSLILWFKSTRKWMTLEQKRDFIVVHCGGCLKRIFDNGAPKHMITSLLTSYAKLTKLAFETEPLLEAAVDFPIGMLMQEPEGSSACVLSLMLLTSIVQEFTRYDSSRSQTYLSFAAHRHCSGNFRDGPFLQIYVAAMKQLEGINSNSPHLSEVVKLVESCLSYDFRAIVMDETEDLPFAQFPASWKSTLLNKDNLCILWGQHASLPYPACASLLQGISHICSIHRTFFDSSEERGQYLEYTLNMLTEITMIRDDRLRIPQYFQVFSDTCLRILISFGYKDLRSVHAFESWIQAFHMLSMEIVSIPFGQEGSFTVANSVLSFWVTLTTSKRRSYPEEERRDIEDVVLQLLHAFIKARVRSPEVDGVDPIAVNEDNYDELTETVLSQSNAYGTICLLDPLASINDLANHLSQHVGVSILSSVLSSGWLFYLAGSIMRLVLPHVEGVGVTSSSHVFTFVVSTAAHRLRREGDPAMFGPFVERGVLHFLTHVQMILAGARLGSLSMIVANVFETPARLFQFLLDNAGHNIMRGADDPGAVEIIRASASIITDACRDAPSNLLRELTFDFPPISELPLAQSESTYKLRTDLMKALWFLTRAEPVTDKQMESYLSNIEVNMQQTMNNEAMSPSFVAGWLRDLRGACRALNEEGAIFNDFVDWTCSHSHVFMTVLNTLGESAVVVNSLMRFLSEIVSTGRYGRLHVHSSSNSALGLVLFRFLCGIIEKTEETVFSDFRVSTINETSPAYSNILKPWILSMDIMKKCIQGSFVPFGAMIYYNDETYENNAFKLLRKLTMVELCVFKQYAKFTSVALDMLRCMTEEGLYFPLIHLDSDELVKLVKIVISLCEDADASSDVLAHGLSFLGFIASLMREVKAILSTPPLQSSVDNITPPPLPLTSLTPPMSMPHSYVSTISGNAHISRGGGQSSSSSRAPRLAREANEKLARLLAPHEDVWQLLISVAMGIIAFRDRAVSASSGVVFPIFDAHPPFWYNFVEQFVASYPERKQMGIREALSILTNARESQEKFFSEVFTFRQALRQLNG